MDEELHGLLPDGASYYAETNPANFVLEPWNAISSLAFLIPVIYFMIKLRGQYKAYPFIMYCMPLLFLGGIGSTLFHAFRYSSWLLWLDVIPIAVLTLSVSVYFWIKILKRKWLIFVIVPLFVALRLFVYGYLDFSGAINLSYLITGAMLFVPGLLYLKKTEFYYAKGLLGAVIFFVAAIIFRRIDFLGTVIMPMGTHWLWHISCAAGAFYLAYYLYHVENRNRLIKQPPTKDQHKKQSAKVKGPA